MVIYDPSIRLNSRSHLFVEGQEEQRARSLGDSRSLREVSCKLGSWRGDARGGEPSSEFHIPTLFIFTDKDKKIVKKIELNSTLISSLGSSSRFERSLSIAEIIEANWTF